MHFLLCSDGSLEADSAARYTALLAAAVRAQVVIFGVAETSSAVVTLETALNRSRQMLQDLSGIRAEVIVQVGDPTSSILARTLVGDYDLVVIGAKRKGGSSLYWRSARAYEIIKAIIPPVLVVMGRPREQLRRVLICTDGKRYIDPAADLAARLLPNADVAVTLLHVMPEPEMRRADPEQMQTQTQELMDSSCALSRNLRAQCHRLSAVGIAAELRLRRGIVLNEVAAEVRRTDYDLVITSSSPARGPLPRYILGDLAREILNRVGSPMLVVRPRFYTDKLETLRRDETLMSRTWHFLQRGIVGLPKPSAPAHAKKTALLKRLKEKRLARRG